MNSNRQNWSWGFAREFMSRTSLRLSGRSRPLCFDSLESRAMLTPLPGVCPPEVICTVDPRDVVAVINYINAFGPGPVPPAPKSLDYNGDDWVTAADALLLINYINASSGGQGEPVAVQPMIQPNAASTANIESTPDSVSLDTWLSLEASATRPSRTAG